MSKDTGGDAFPSQGSMGVRVATGMTLRDYFAARALAGMASQFHENWTTLGAAQAAYELADAMLAERVK